MFSEKLMEIYVRDIHNDMTKPFEHGVFESVVDSVTQGTDN